VTIENFQMTDNSINKAFEAECREQIAQQGDDQKLTGLARDFFNESAKHKYSYHFSWMGRPIIQLPQDMMAMQEIIWQVKPDLVIECGIAHGGSIIYYASLLELQGHGEVLGIDLDIRSHNREAIESHPMSKRISMIEGSSIDPAIAAQVRAAAEGKKVILVLDSNHTHDHVLEELRLYAPLVSVDSYCVVMDTVVEDMPADFFPDRPWGPGDNPKTAVWKYLEENKDFEIDQQMQNKLLITVAPDGYLRRVR
jgi:cephalosporin hydroxylase